MVNLDRLYYFAGLFGSMFCLKILRQLADPDSQSGYFGSQHTPLLAPPQGGEAASSIKFREATEADADGVVFLSLLIGKPPRPRYQWRLRDIPLIARPPILAVMQGGECACSKLIHMPPPVRLHTLSIHPLQSISVWKPNSLGKGIFRLHASIFG